jgi:uncharacterized protein YecT (DUF1311 family)
VERTGRERSGIIKRPRGPPFTKTLAHMQNHYGLRILFVTMAFVWVSPVHADWSVVGAATRCEYKKGFTVAATVDASEGIFKVPPEEGFTPLSDGKNEIHCTVGEALVAASITVFPPSASHCMGSGFVSMSRLNIGAVVAFGTRSFLWNCDSVEPQKLLTRLSVLLQNDRLIVEACYADWDDSVGYTGISCTAENVNRFHASFDCTKAATKVEVLVCNSQDLSRLDHILFRTYQEAMGFTRNPLPIRRSQRQWLKKERDSCVDRSCLQTLYEKRINELRGLIPKVESNQMGNY